MEGEAKGTGNSLQMQRGKDCGVPGPGAGDGSREGKRKEWQVISVAT